MIITSWDAYHSTWGGIVEHLGITVNEMLRRLGVPMRIVGPPAENVVGIGYAPYRVALCVVKGDRAQGLEFIVVFGRALRALGAIRRDWK